MRDVRSITFDPDGSATIEYLSPEEDLRVNGVILNHAMLVPSCDDYDGGIDDARNAALALLDDVLSDLVRVPAVDLEEPEDDVPSSYDNPLER
jgi:hypothetical protein